MKTFITAMLLAIPFFSQAQDNQAPVLFSTVYLRPVPSQIGQFRDGVKAHRAKFHKDGTPYEARIYRVASGSSFGDYVWLEGPQTYSDYDKSPGEGHGPDLDGKVSAYMTDFGQAEYWRVEGNYFRTGSKNQPVMQVRFLEVNIEDRQGYRMDGLFRQLSETMKSLPGDFSWGIYGSDFQQGKAGRHFAFAGDFASWAEMGKLLDPRGNRDIRAAFDKLHGEGAFEKWRTEMEEVFADSYDEIWTLEDL